MGQSWCQDDIVILNVYQPNIPLLFFETKVNITEGNRQIHNLETLIPLSWYLTEPPLNVSKDIKELNNTINQQKLIDMYRTLYHQQQNAHSSAPVT